MTIEQLLQPRIKCINPFLGMKREGWELGLVYTIESWNDDNLFVYKLPAEFPHNFKLLDWWEERKPEDMPEYVKTNNKDYEFSVQKVVKYRDDYLITQEWDQYQSIKIFVPATKEEYDQFIKPKESVISFVRLGRYYGYPECCINAFCKTTNLTKEQQKVHGGTGFIPCPQHSIEILNGAIKIEDLIVNRQCEKEFPNEF